MKPTPKSKAKTATPAQVKQTRSETQQEPTPPWRQAATPSTSSYEARETRSTGGAYTDAYQDKDHSWQDWKKTTYSWGSSQQRLLPIQEKRAEVIPVICGTARVVCLLGETGSGKSTQVPQMILQQARAANLNARVCVTQPRRVAALNLANRVATELGESIGNSVGYRIGGESRPGYNIDFCTVGYTLQLFLNSPEEFGNYTHIILDEVHERSAESDMLCLVVRLLAQHRFQQTRLIVMSATLQSDLFARYFAPISRMPVGRVFVGARCFKVTQHFLEELPAALGRKLRCESLIMSRVKDVFGTVKPKKIDQKHCDKLHKVIIEVLEVIATPDSTILVFLPGIAEISSLWQEAKELEYRSFKIFPLHSMVPREEQELVFQEPDPGITNVVLATDIAESSITLPHVVAVIDLGLHRRVDHDATKGVASLATKWISKAAATQRSGRAGRTQPGICLRLYTKAFYDKHMHDFEPPECTSMSLDRLYLQAKQLSTQLSQSLKDLRVPRGAQELLAQLPEAPDLSRVALARQKNAELGTISNATEVAQITALGYLCLHLPLDLKLTRLVWLGAHFGVAADAVVLASVISSQDAFSMPSPLFMWEESEFVNRLRSAASARLLFDGGELSEPLMQRQLFLEWLTDFHHNEYVCGDKERVLWARRRHTMDFSYHYSLSKGRMEHVVSYVVDLSLRAHRACMPNSRAAKSLSELLFALGYTVNHRGDLAGIPVKEWRAFHPEEQAFETDTSYLKALMAAAFSDHLFIGSYGSISKDLDGSGKSAQKQVDQLQALQKLMKKHNLSARETVLFSKDQKDPGEYVEHVCGSQPRRVIQEETHTLVELSLDATSEAARWRALASRKSAPLLVSKSRLPAEFNLLSQFEKHMRELMRVQATGWTYKPVSFMHPHILRWEWMEPLYTSKGVPMRCEGMFDKKNSVGLVGSVQSVEEDKLKPVACFAVAATVRGGAAPTNCYPEAVTCLSPGHIAFVLSTTKLDLTKSQLRRFGFTTRGELAVLHRCVDLPPGCLYGSAWEKIRALRQALQKELQFEMPSKDTPVLYDSDVSWLAKDLFEAVPIKAQEANLNLDRDCSLGFLSNTTVNLLQEELPTGAVHEAFLPVADWKTLVERRQALVTKINSQVKGKAPLPPGRVEWTKGATRRSRSRRRSRREGRERSRSRRSRKRPMQAEPKEHKPQKQPRQVKASEAGLYDLVLQVIERWGIACDDEVGDERFKSAINLVLSARVFGPREVERINSQLNRQLKRPKVRPRGPGSTSNLRVPTALAELEKRNVDMVRNLNMQEGILAGEAQAQAAAGLPGRSRAVPVAEPAAEPEPGLGPDKEPEEREELEEEEPEEPQEARMVEDEADAGEAEVVDEESPASPAEVPGLAPFTPSPNGESDWED